MISLCFNFRHSETANKKNNNSNDNEVAIKFHLKDFDCTNKTRRALTVVAMTKERNAQSSLSVILKKERDREKRIEPQQDVGTPPVPLKGPDVGVSRRNNPPPVSEFLIALKSTTEEITSNLISLVFAPRKHIARVPAATERGGKRGGGEKNLKKRETGEKNQAANLSLRIKLNDSRRF